MKSLILILKLIFSFSLVFHFEGFSQEVPVQKSADEPLMESPFYLEELMASVLSVKEESHQKALVKRILKKDENSGIEVIIFLIKRGLSESLNFDLAVMALKFSKDKKNIEKILNTLTSLREGESARHLIPRGATMLGRGEKTVKLLENGLKDSDPEVRRLSALMLPLILEGETALKKLSILSQSSDEHIRRGAAFSVVRLKEDRLMKGIIQTLKDDSLSSVKLDLLKGIHHHKQYQYLGLVLDAFTSDPDSNVRFESASAVVFLDDAHKVTIELGNFSTYPEGKSKKRVLMERLSKDTDLYVRYNLAKSINYLVDNAEDEKLAEDILIQLAKDRTLRVASAAVKTALLRIDNKGGYNTGREVLITAVRKHLITDYSFSRLGMINFTSKYHNSGLPLFENKELWFKKLSRIQGLLRQTAADESLSGRVQLAALKILSNFYYPDEITDKTLRRIASSRNPYRIAVREQAQRILRNSCSPLFSK